MYSLQLNSNMVSFMYIFLSTSFVLPVNVFKRNVDSNFGKCVYILRMLIINQFGYYKLDIVRKRDFDQLHLTYGVQWQVASV